MVNSMDSLFVYDEVNFGEATYVVSFDKQR